MRILKQLSLATASAAFVALGMVEVVHAVTISFTGNTTSAPRFNRSMPDLGATTQSPPTLLSERGTDVPYRSQAFSVDTAGNYNFLSSQSYDGFLALYQGAFDPSDALSNIIVANEDYFSTPQNNTYSVVQPYTSGFNNVPLSTNTQYFLVTTGYANNSVGPYANTIASSDSAATGTITLDPTPVPFEFSPGLGILALGTCGAVAQLKNKMQKWKVSKSNFSKS